MKTIAFFEYSARGFPLEDGEINPLPIWLSAGKTG
jgi:hypothetical protein